MASSNPLKILVFYGGYRPQRHGIKLARFIVNHLKQRKHNVTLFDAMEMPFNLLAKPIHFYKEGEVVPDWMISANNQIKESDALVMVCGEYNWCPQPGLLNMIDHFFNSYRYKVSAIASYSAGGFSGIRASCAVREKLSCLETIISPQQFCVPQIIQAFDDEANPTGDRKERLQTGIDRFIRELEWVAHAIKDRKDSVGIPNK
ncbi:uncharacterized protein LOC141899179 [Tubulanus polymorphus]|uniref:uncharacterized protein LOC141899179 n=1 Tax=Tubulanus polymorphus TaxID=672921 RepID=UPI003DA2A5B6